MDRQHPTHSTEPLIGATVVDGPHLILPQGRGAHDAGLAGDVEVRFADHVRPMLAEDGLEGDELGVPCPLTYRKIKPATSAPVPCMTLDVL